MADKVDVPTELHKLAELYAERNALYGQNFVGFSWLLRDLHTFTRGAPLLPEAPTLRDYARIGILVQMASKMSRYMAQWGEGGHEDSLDDLAVYAQMMKKLDAMSNAEFNMWPAGNLPPAKVDE